MSTSRSLVCSSRLFSRACTTIRATRPACLSMRVPLVRRQFATSNRLLQETVDTPSQGQEIPRTASPQEPSVDHARSVAIFKVPKRATPAEIRNLFQSKGLEITQLQLRLDRFTFHNDARCFVELASEQQAQKAVEILHNTEFLSNTIVAAPLKADFVWGPLPNDGNRSLFFYENSTSPAEAMKPLLEGRRKMISVQTPGWLSEVSSVGHNVHAHKVLQEHFGPHGIESISSLQPFHGDKQRKPRMLCFMDFKTKEGAEQAQQAIHDTSIEGRKVWVMPSILAPWRAHQIGKVDSALLTRLQEAGVASLEPYEDNFVNSDQKKGKKNYKTTRAQRVANKRAE